MESITVAPTGLTTPPSNYTPAASTLLVQCLANLPVGRVTADPDVTAHEELGEQKPPPPAQSFEWIQHGDASARKRARAHITRGFRRQKAADAKENKEKEKARGKGSGSGSGNERSQGTQPNNPLDTESESNVLDRSSIQPYEAVGHLGQELALHPTLGSGRGDPFSSLPVDLRPGANALLDHCTYDIRSKEEIVLQSSSTSSSSTCQGVSGGTSTPVKHMLDPRRA